MTRLLAVALLLTLCGCHPLQPQSESHSQAQAQPQAQPSAASPRGHVEMVDPPANGDVAGIVRSELARARKDGRHLVVYVGATWCEPCQHFHKAAAAGQLDDKFPSLRLLTFDEDRDSERLAAAGYVSRYIPLFALPGADGRASGQQIEGSIKGEGAVMQISPRLTQLLTKDR